MRKELKEAFRFYDKEGRDDFLIIINLILVSYILRLLLKKCKISLNWHFYNQATINLVKLDIYKTHIVKLVMANKWNV
jgi:hypothetical protein